MESKKIETYNMVEVAKILNISFNNFILGRNILYEYLRYFEVLQEFPNKNIPFPEYYKKGYFKAIPISKYVYTGYKTVVTHLGLEWLECDLKSLIIEEEKKYLAEYYPTFKY